MLSPLLSSPRTRRTAHWSALGFLTLLAACGQAPSSPTGAVNAGTGPSRTLSSLMGPQSTVSGAVYTTTNVIYDPAGTCLNGPAGGDPVNCNIYQEKDDVWLSGGPSRPGGTNTLEPGTYFFSILVPGGQLDPRDGTDKNLSDDFDTYQNRTFTFDGTGISGYTPDLDALTADHVLSGGKLQAFSYADTTNNGGEYILAVCSLAGGIDNVRPSKCKYDAFKVKKAGDPVEEFVTANLSGFKYLDTDLNGIRNVPTSEPLAGWNVTVTCDGVATPLVTDADGGWTTTLVLPRNADLTSCTVTEGTLPGWTQTGNTADETSSSGTGTAATLNADKTYSVTIGHADDGTVTELNFGNVPLSVISGQKLYGAAGTVPIGFWKVTLSGATVAGTPVSATTVTDAGGAYTFGNLLPGSYTVTESLPSTNLVNSRWAALSATSYTRAVSVSGTTVTTPVPLQNTVAAFRNVCQVNPGGKTLGFWSNTNGARAALTITNPTALVTLVGLNLRNANGTNFDPATYASFQRWLLGANATNMAHMLSAQMSATTLNTLSTPRYTDPSVTVYSATVPATTIAQLLLDANASLGLNGLTVAASATRTSQENLKILLDRINNSGELAPIFFDQPGSGRCTAINAATAWTP